MLLSNAKIPDLRWSEFNGRYPFVRSTVTVTQVVVSPSAEHEGEAGHCCNLSLARRQADRTK